jgi:hypothetical protein
MDTNNANQDFTHMINGLNLSGLMNKKNYFECIAGPMAQRYWDTPHPIPEVMALFTLSQICVSAGPQELQAVGAGLINAYALAKAAWDADFPNNPVGRLPAWSSQGFVDSLEKVDIATIAQDDMRCFHCWNDFGVTCEDENPDAYAADMNEEEPELWVILSNFRELPFCECKTSNDPVRTRCGHLIGYTCLVDILEATGNTACPMCRQDICTEWTRTALPRRH